MKPENRKKCQCDSCRYNNLDATVTLQHNVNVPTENSFEVLSEEEIADDDHSNFVTIRRAKRKTGSLPDLSTSILSPASYKTNGNHSNIDKSPQVALDGDIDQNSTIEILKLEISELRCKLQSANINIKKLNMTIKNIKNQNKRQEIVTNVSTLTRKNKQKVKALQPETPSSSLTNKTKIKQSTIRLAGMGKLDRKRNKLTKSKTKICLISSTDRDKTSKAIRSNFEEQNLCHYRMPGGGITQLMSGIDTKLKNFTYNDYCVLFLGETDFNVSKDYRKLVKYVRECLLSVQHTNVIFCLPTFKFSYQSNIYNRRVEMFNRIIYFDNLNYNYCYILDSNKNLNYSFDMFLKFNGKINIHGLKIILNDINELINSFDIELISDDDWSEGCVSDSSFSSCQENVIESGKHSFRA